MARDPQQNPEQIYQKPPSGLRVFAGKLLKGILIGAAVTAAIGALCLIPAIGVPVAGALAHAHLGFLVSSIGAHATGAGAAAHAAHAAKIASIGWGAVVGVGAAAGAVLGGIVGVFKGARQSKINKMEQAYARAQQQEQSLAMAPQQSMGQGQGTALDNTSSQVPDNSWQQRIAAQRQQASASVPPL